MSRLKNFLLSAIQQKKKSGIKPDYSGAIFYKDRLMMAPVKVAAG